MRHSRTTPAVLLTAALLLPGALLPEAGARASPRDSQAQFAPAANDATAHRCDLLAEDPTDPHKAGAGVPFGQINVTVALPACQQAVAHSPLRARYQFLYGRVLLAAQRYAESFEQFGSANAAGYPLAAAGLALLYANGAGVPQDLERAAVLYRDGADAGDPFAYFGLGWLYETGNGGTKDLQLARKWYIKAGDAGVADGYAAAGGLTQEFPETGLPGPTTPGFVKAAEWYQKAVEGGSIRGAMMLANLYQQGWGVAKDMVKAAALYRVAADQGDADAMHELATLYRWGWGVPKDRDEVTHWMREAAQRGNTEAQWELGYMMYLGEGMPRDPQAAFNLLLPAANAGMRLPQETVAIMYEFGEGVAKDSAAAVAWFRKASDDDTSDLAMTRLGAHLWQGDGAPQDQHEAMQWFTKAAERGYAAGESWLGYGYMQGADGGAPDYGQAAIWLDRAARQGDPAAQINLATLYERGWGVPQDSQRARDLYMRATGSPVPEYAERARAQAKLLEQPYISSDPEPSAAPPAGRNDDVDDGTVPMLVAGAIGAALVWSIVKNLSGPSDPDSDTTDYDPLDIPMEDPINNAYRQYLDEQHNACVWSHTDISGC